MSLLDQTFSQVLSRRKEKGLFRSLNVSPPDLIDFSSNNTLNLCEHPLLKERSLQYLHDFGCGSKASRLVTGTAPFYPAIEKKIARFKGKPAALIFNSGYQANISILSSLLNRHCLVLADRLCHHSLIQGIRLSQAKLLRFRHNDYEHLEELLEKHSPHTNTFIVSESVFGMDGDIVDLDRLIEIKKHFSCTLYIDEAHATGVFGKQGRGLAANRPQVDIVMGTFSKAMGSFGAYVASSQVVKDYLINCCGGFVYSTALPPSVIGSIDAALDLVPTLEKERQKIFQRSESLRTFLKNLRIDYGNSSSHILPILTKTEEKTAFFEQKLKSFGIQGISIRPPTVPEGTSRIRLSISSAHTEQDLNVLKQALS